MAKIDMLCRQLIKSEDHKHIFCSEAQFPEWSQAIQGASSDKEVVEGRDLSAEQKSLVYIRNKFNSWSIHLG